MTANVPLLDLLPGDQILDLVATGTVESVVPMRRADGRPADAIRVNFSDGSFMAGPSTWTVIVTSRQDTDA